jgi:hypothetical protein
MDLTVSIRPASNGFIIHYSELINDLEVNAEFIALDLEEALDVIRDCYDQQETHDMSNILDETIPKD